MQLTALRSDPDVASWLDGLRLNPSNGLMARLAEPDTQELMASFMAVMGPAFANLSALTTSAMIPLRGELTDAGQPPMKPRVPAAVTSPGG
jgi:hypothetical protein